MPKLKRHLIERIATNYDVSTAMCGLDINWRDMVFYPNELCLDCLLLLDLRIVANAGTALEGGYEPSFE